MSIVTVCLNDLQGLRSTYESIKLQFQLPQQWIVADGGSTDGTCEWLRSIEHWPLLEWSSAVDGGIYQGMNRGLARADGEYVLFLNSGDVLSDPNALESVHGALALADFRPTLLFGDCFEVGPDGVGQLRRARPPWWVWLGMPTTHQAMYFRVDALDAGFDTRYRLSGDYAAIAYLYMARRGADFLLLPRPLCRFHLGGRSDQMRRAFLRENMEIRQRILGMSRIPAIALHAAHHVQGWIKKYTPALHRAMRYG